METKPIVTCHGDQSLFSSLHASLLKGLPREPTEWRRSYSRAPKTVFLEASFVPYDEDILPKETDKTLVSRPYFHIFWTSCDLETYKQTLKEELAEWANALKNQNIPDWLIVVVVNDESKVKTKLLPRASVIDKVKSDFCNKQPDRCIVLTEPLKQDQKSVESWSVFLQRLRNLLLQAFNRHLNKYEENMRNLRERRNEPGWSFTNFFLVQEELGFMFEMLGLFDDALIQYDELDAIFTQFILTHTAGTSVSWLQRYTSECSKWGGLSLRKAINWDLRDLIKTDQCNLVDLRDYLFSRQCALLFLQKRPWEVARRAMEFLHNTIQEVAKLKIKMPPGSLDCWVFLSCIEILQTCQKHADSAQVQSYSLYTASLWDYARRKLHVVGDMCGLNPDPSVQPSSEQLQLVLDLISGMGTSDDADDDTDMEETVQKPGDKLREALSSKEAFQKIYLELSELAMGTYKHISRFRCARLIGKDLADFYMKLGEPQKAENFLMDSMKSYHQEGWHDLADGTKLELAKCQKQLGNRLKYIKTACQVVGSTTLSRDVREWYLSEIINIAMECSDANYLLKTAPLFNVENIIIRADSLHINETLVIDLKIECDIPSEIKCDTINLSLKKCAPQNRSVASKKLLCKTDSGGMLKEQVPNFNPVRQRTPSMIQVKAQMEGSPGKLSSCSIVCVNTHDVLRRTDSTRSQKRESTQIKEEYSSCLSLSDVVLHPGSNTLHMTDVVTQIGTFQPNQLCYKVGGLEFVKTLVTDLYIDVCHDEPYCDIKPLKGEYILSGVTQKVTISVHPGSFVLEPGDTLKLTTSEGFVIKTEDDSDIVTINETKNKEPVQFNVTMYHERSEEVVVEGRLKIECAKFHQPLSTVVSFNSPFLIKHQVHTAGKRKYLQVKLEGTTEDKFALTNPNLQTGNTNVELLPLNRPGQNLSVNRVQTVSYLWEVKCNTLSVNSLHCVFSLIYSSDLDIDDVTKKLDYAFEVDNFQTIYLVDVSPMPDCKSYKVGSLAIMKVKVTQLLPCNDSDSLMYEIDDTPANWAVSGKSSGPLEFENDKFEITLSVMPLVAGYIHVPRIHLYLMKYVQDILIKQERNVTETQEEDTANETSSSDQNVAIQHKNRMEFNPGQVYYASFAKQVQVYQDSGDTDVEISLESDVK